jgi:hypothetical protein
VTLHCTASDAGLGLASPADASFDLHTSVAAGTETADAATDARQVCDLAGNCDVAGPITGNKVDRLAPQITVTVPANGQQVTQDDALTAGYACSDGGSGIGSCTGPVANGGAISTATAGDRTFTVTAVDAAGNQAQTTVAWTVKAKDPPPVDPPTDPPPPPPAGTLDWQGWTWPTASDGSTVAWFHLARLHFVLGGRPGDHVVSSVQLARCGSATWTPVQAASFPDRGWHWGWWHRHHGWGAHHHWHNTPPPSRTPYTVLFRLDWRTHGCVSARVTLTDGSTHTATVTVR